MDRIKDFLAKCKNVSTIQPDSELFVLENEGIELIDALRAGEIEGVTAEAALDEARKITAAVTALQNEAEVRIQAAEERNKEWDELGLQRPEPPATPEGIENADQTDDAKAASEAESGPEDQPSEPGEGESGDNGGEGGGDDEPAQPAPEPQPQPEPEPVTASTRPSLAAFRPSPRREAPPAEPVSRGDIDMIGPDGERVTSFARADELIGETLSNVLPQPGRQLKTTVLRRRYDWSADRFLKQHDIKGNTEKVKALTAGALDPDSWVDDKGEMKPFTAAGQFCAPSEPFYGQPVIGDRGRPLRDGLPGMGLDRGSIEVSASPVLTDITVDTAGGAIDTLDPSSSTGTKTIMDVVTCPSPVVTYLEATSVRLRFTNWDQMTWRERVEAWTQLALVRADRHREQRLLAKMDALSTAVSESFVVGAYRDVLNHLGRLVSAERHRQRMSPDSRFRVVFDFGLFDAMREDIAMQMPGDGPGVLARAESEMRADLSARGINLTVVWDRWIPAAQSAGTMTWWPAQWAINVFPEGTFMFGGGPGLDFGVVRDGDEIAGNTFQTFSEEFETVFKIGSWPAYLLNLNVCVNGVTAGTTDTSDECQGS
jgi:hypothetical protein